MDRLKVDQSFIRRLPGQPAVRAAVDAIITLARSLGLGVIAEGVETDQEAGFLRERKCLGHVMAAQCQSLAQEVRPMP